MRVVAGSLGGRTFDSPGSDRTHPMSDKMRGALFNILGDINDLRVLDAFGGSGALAFEAASRGAKSVLILDNDKAAQRTIEQNIQNLAVDRKVQLVKAPAGAWLSASPDMFFDIVLCDPPYDALQLTLLEQLTARVTPGGIFVLSYPRQQVSPHFHGLEQIKQQSYGDAQLIFYRS